MQLTFDADVEAFREEFVAFLDEHLPSEADALERSRSSSHIPEWARHWQRLMFDNGWLLPGYPPEFGGRNATLRQQYVHQQELARRRAYLTFNPQGVAAPVLRRHASNRSASSAFCSSAARGRPIGTAKVNRCTKRRRVIGSGACWRRGNRQLAGQGPRKASPATAADSGTN